MKATPPPAGAEQRDWTSWLHEQRRILVNVLTGLVMILGMLGVAYTLWIVVRRGSFSFVSIYYITSYLVALLLFTARRIPDNWRSYLLLTLIYVFAVFALYSGWLAGSGRLYLLVMVVAAAVLLNPRSAAILGTFSLLTYVAFSLALSRGWIHPPAPADLMSVSVILLEGVGFAMAIALVTGSVWYFGRALMAASLANQQAQTARAQVDAHAQELEAANRLIAAQKERIEAESEGKFRVLFRAAPVAIMIQRPGQGVIEVNDTLLRMTGFEREEIIGRTWSDLKVWVDPDEQARAAEIMSQEGRLSGFEFLLRRKNGEIGNMVMWAEKVEINGAEHYISTTLDITERKQMESSLAESEAKFRSIIEQASDAIVLCNEQGLITHWNPASEQMTGLPRYLVLGTPLWELQARILPAAKRTDESVERLRTKIQAILNGESDELLQRLMEGELARPDGTRRFFQQLTFPIRTGRGIMIGSVIRDATDRKLTEMDRESLIRELSAKNAELERFTYTVSHDLKSPLVTIRGFAGYLEQDIASGNAEHTRRDVERISNAAARMERLLDELLELSRIGRRMNTPVSIPFADLVREALALTEGRLRAANVQVSVAPDLPAVFGDRVRLVEVLQNLIDNAAKFMGAQPRPRIEIGARQDGGQTVFFVRDNGIGIEPRFHEKVFGLFDKLDPRSDGTGIGLALVKRIVEVHGGRVWVESGGAGSGSAFCFTLAAAPVREE